MDYIISQYGVSELTSARQRFIVNKLLDKGGVLNKVATRYILSSFNVRIKPSVKHIDIVAVKGDLKYGIKVFYEKKTISRSDIENFIKSCSENGFKPVLVLYGNGPELSEELSGEAGSSFLLKRIRTLSGY